MSNPAEVVQKPTSVLARVPFYYGWIILGLAALAMVGTLPGRTQGLGLITESLLSDLNLDRVTFAQMNLWATLLGSLFCLGIGRLMDQPGSRVVLTAVALALGGVVLAMSGTSSVAVLFLLLTLTRGLGQSALSIVSLTMMGQWFNRRLNLAMALYSVTLSIGFMAAFPIIGGAVQEHGWRATWATIGWVLILGLAPLGWLLARRRPESIGLKMESGSVATDSSSSPGFTWLAALRTPAFWVFALASATYNLVASGIGLFNESILAERGFAAGIYYRSLVITALTSLVGNFLGGWLAEKWSMQKLLTLAMALLAGALLSLPWLRAVWQVDIFAVVMGGGRRFCDRDFLQLLGAHIWPGTTRAHPRRRANVDGAGLGRWAVGVSPMSGMDGVVCDGVLHRRGGGDVAGHRGVVRARAATPCKSVIEKQRKMPHFYTDCQK